MKTLLFFLSAFFLCEIVLGEQYVPYPPSFGVNCASGSSGQVWTTNGSICSFQTISSLGSLTVTNLTDTGLTASRAIFTDSGKLLTSASTTGTQLNYLAIATGTTGTGNLVFSIAPTLTGTTTVGNILDGGLTVSRALFADSGGVISSATTTATQLNYLASASGTTGTGNLVLSAAPTLTGTTTVGNILDGGLTVSRALFSDSGGIISSATTTATQLNYLASASGTSGTGNLILSASPTLTGTIVATSLAASGDITKGNCYVSPKESDLGNSGASLAIDLSTAATFTATLTNNTPTVTFSNPVAGCAYAIVFTQDGTGSRVPSFAGTTILWGNTGTHTFSTTAAAVDKFTCVYDGLITSLLCDLGTKYQ